MWSDKYSHINARRKNLGDLLGMFEVNSGPANIPQERVTTTRMNHGREEVVIYERADGDKIKILDQHALEKRREMVEKNPKISSFPLSVRVSYRQPVPVKQSYWVMCVMILMEGTLI